jgi:hypothetical protein
MCHQVCIYLRHNIHDDVFTLIVIICYDCIYSHHDNHYDCIYFDVSLCLYLFVSQCIL